MNLNTLSEEEAIQLEELLAKHEKDGTLAAIQQIIDDYGLEKAQDEFDDRYDGAYDSRLEWVYEYIDRTGLLSGIPHSVACYFNYDQFLYDQEISGMNFVYDTSIGKYHALNYTY